MKPSKLIGIRTGLFFLLVMIFLLLSGYFIPGRDPDIGAFQLMAILICGTASLCAFDVALLLPHHVFLKRRDWLMAVILVFGGVTILGAGNIVKELHLTGRIVRSVLTSLNYLGILLLLGGFYWRFQHQLDTLARKLVNTFIQILSFRWRSRYFMGLPFMVSVLFLAAGGFFAYNETRSMEVILNPVRLLFILSSIYLVGRSVLKFFLGDLQTPAIQVLSPLAGMTLWALVLGIGVGLRIPVWQISIPLWCLTGFLAWRGISTGEHKTALPWLGIALLLTLLVTFPYTLNGFSVYMGSPSPDGWSYIAYGQYLWRHERGVSAGLQPIYQYAAHLSHTRYLSGSLLGFLSPVTGQVGDTQSASGFFFPVVIFAYSSTMVAFSLHYFSRTILRAIFILLAVPSGWIFTVMTVNNLDQAMVLAFLPGMAILMGKPRFDRPRWVLWIAFMLAACTYIYAEMTVFIVFSIVVLSFEQIIRQKILLKHWLLGGLGIFALVVFLLSPFLSNLFPFLRAQFELAGRANRPGGNLVAELLRTKYGFIALWGLGAELFADRAESFWFNVRLWLACFSGILLLTGSFLQLKAGKIGTFAVTTFFIGVIYYYLYFQNYPYAAYKLISISWWLAVALMVEGIGFALSTRHDLIKHLFRSLTWAAVAVFLTIFYIRSDLFAKSLDTKWITPFRQLESLPIPDGEPVIASVWGWLPNQWAMYYLRERSSLVYPYRSYAAQKHVISFMERGAPVKFGEVHAILTDRGNPFSPSRQILWQNEFYTLWKMPIVWAYVAEVSDPAANVQADRPNSLRLTGDTNLVIIASRNEEYVAHFDCVSSSTDHPGMYLFTIAPSNTEIRYDLTEGHQTIILPLSEGRNQINIQPVNPPSGPGSAQTNPPLIIENLEIIFQS